jgi:HEAT repeat protein
VRATVATALRSRVSDPAVLSRLRELAADPDPAVRAAAVTALRLAVTDTAVRDQVLRSSEDAATVVRVGAATALLGAADDPEVCRRLFALVDDDDEDVRFAAANALAASPLVDASVLVLESVAAGPSLLRGLAELVRSTAPYRLRVLAAPLLATLHGGRVDVVPDLLEGLLDLDDDVRTECGRGLTMLGRLGDPTVGPRLAATFADDRFERPDAYQDLPAWDYAYEALSALGEPAAATEEPAYWRRARAAHDIVRARRPDRYG